MSSNNAKMPASMKNNSKQADGNVTDSKSTATPVTTTTAIKRELSALTLSSNGMPKLSSLTPARDLTLGGRGGGTTNKKVFLPNLNVVRNKNAKVKTSKDTTVSRGRGRGRGADRGGSRGGRGGSSSLIQTTGVFSEGAGAVNLRPSARSSGYSRDVDDSPSAMRKPTIFKSEKKLDMKDVLAKDLDILKSLDDIDGDDGIEQKTDLDKIPVQLNEDSVAVASQMQALHLAQQAEQQNKPLPRYPQTMQELLDSNNQSQMFLMQLPDALPCVNDDDSDSPEISTKPCTSSATETTNPASTTVENKKPIKLDALKKLDEGQVGRLIRYKSGKTKLVLGQNYFNLDIGIETGFLQELMSINCNREERSGNMINLGLIQAKITATPDWEHLLMQPSSSNKKHV